MAEPKVVGGPYDVADRNEKLEKAKRERQQRMADFLRRTKVDIRFDREARDPREMERDYKAAAEARLEQELYAAGAKGGLGIGKQEDID